MQATGNGDDSRGNGFDAAAMLNMHITDNSCPLGRLGLSV